MLSPVPASAVTGGPATASRAESSGTPAPRRPAQLLDDSGEHRPPALLLGGLWDHRRHRAPRVCGGAQCGSAGPIVPSRRTSWPTRVTDVSCARATPTRSRRCQDRRPPPRPRPSSFGRQVPDRLGPRGRHAGMLPPRSAPLRAARAPPRRSARAARTRAGDCVGVDAQRAAPSRSGRRLGSCALPITTRRGWCSAAPGPARRGRSATGHRPGRCPCRSGPRRPGRAGRAPRARGLPGR